MTRIGSRTALLPRDPQVKPPAARDLLYLAPSPDFCHLDPENGIPGTAGRRCNGKIDGKTISQENNQDNLTYKSKQFQKIVALFWNIPRNLSAGTRWLWAGVLRAGIQSGPGWGGAALFLQVFLVLLSPLPAVQEHSHHSYLQSLKGPKQDQTACAERPEQTTRQRIMNTRQDMDRQDNF